MAEDVTTDPEWRLGFFSSLIGILVRPTSTMRRILDQDRLWWVIPIVLLALVSESLEGLDLGGLSEAFGSIHPAVLALMILGLVALAGLIALALFGALAGVATLVGRYLLEGKGTYREVLTALAWGLGPIAISLLYKIPLMLIGGFGRGSVAHVSGDHFSWSASGLATGNWGWAIVSGLLEILFFGWFVVVSSQTVGVAHRFSGWHGFACLLLTWISPALILLAVFLTAITA